MKPTKTSLGKKKRTQPQTTIKKELLKKDPLIGDVRIPSEKKLNEIFGVEPKKKKK